MKTRMVVGAVAVALLALTGCQNRSKGQEQGQGGAGQTGSVMEEGTGGGGMEGTGGAGMDAGTHMDAGTTGGTTGTKKGEKH